MTKEKTKQVKRLFKDDIEIPSDTFKCESANYLKNLSWDVKNPNYEPTAHVHYFHTYDSKGRKMEKATATGGHTHIINVTTDKDGNLVGECGPAVKEIRPGQYTELKHDNHTHEVRYLKSDRITKSTLNPDAVKAFSRFDSPKFDL